MAERPRGLFKRLTEALFEEVKPAGGADAAARPAASPSPPSEPEPAAELVPPAEGPAASVERDLIAEEMAEAPALQAFESTRSSPVRLAAAQAGFEVRLHRLMEERPHCVAGKMQLLDLDTLKEAVGERWREVADRAVAIAEQVIASRLAASDVFAPFEDTGFVMLFAELNEQQAKLKAAAIAREIRERLVGELGGTSAGDKSWVKAYVTTLPPGAPGEPPTIEFLEQSFAKAPDIAPPPRVHSVDPELLRRLGEVGIIFRPTLFAPRKVVSIYDCRAQRLDNTDRVHSGVHAYYRGDAPMVFEIDRAVLQLTLRQLRLSASITPLPLLQVTLHTASLLAISGGQLLDLCQTLPQPLRRNLVIELAGTTVGGAFNPRLGELVQKLQPFCRAVTARAKPGVLEIDRLARYGFLSVGIDLDDPDIHLAPGMLKVDVLPLARLAHVVKMQAYLYGIPSAELAQAAREAGFDYLNGRAVAAEVALPAPVQAYAGQA